MRAFDLGGRGAVRALAVVQVVAELEGLAQRRAEREKASSTALEAPASAAPISSGPSTV